jgi:hypothetical protein
MLELGLLKEFFLAVARTVLSATIKYAAPATARKCISLIKEENNNYKADNVCLIRKVINYQLKL